MLLRKEEINPFGQSIDITLAQIIGWNADHIQGLCDTAIKNINITETVDLSPDHPQSASTVVSLLFLLKEATARGLIVSWSLFEDSTIEPLPFSHLWPPLEEGASNPTVEEWRDTYRFGKCYWRNGGKFIEVIDKRDPDNQFQHLIDELPMINLFKAAAVPTPRGDLERISKKALHELEAANLIWSYGEYCLSVPYRIASWPIPYRSI